MLGINLYLQMMRKKSKTLHRQERKQKEIEMQSKQKNFSIESFGDASNNKKLLTILLKLMCRKCEAIISSLQSIENPDVGPILSIVESEE